MTIPVAEFDRRFTEGWAQYLAAAGIGLTWRPADPYLPAETGIWLSAFPADPAFDNSAAVVLTPYLLTADPVYSDTEVGLQVKTRAPGQDPRAVWELDNRISAVLLGRYDFTLPTGLHIVQLTPGPSGSLGQDSNRRWQHVSNYPCLTNRSTTYRV